MLVSFSGLLKAKNNSFTGQPARVSTNSYASASRQLVRTLKSDSFVRSTSVASKLKRDNISFGYEFELKKPTGIPCAYCGKDTLSRNDIKEISALKGRALVDKLEKYVLQNPSAMNEQAKKALKLFEKTALDNPQKDGRELLPAAYTRARNRMLIKQMAVYSKTEKLAKKLNSKELLGYISKVKDQDNILNPDISLEELSDFLINKIHVEFRKDILSNVIKIAGKNNDPRRVDLWSDVISTISSLPSSKTDPDAYLVKYISKALRRDPKMENDLVLLSDSEAELFYAKLLSPFVASAEHIKPFSAGGVSSPRNYLVTHAHCNSKRGNKKWSDFMLDSPFRFETVLKNIQTIANSPEIAEQTRGFSIKSYVNKVAKTMINELADVSSDEFVDGFITRLSAVSDNVSDTSYNESLFKAAQILDSALYSMDENYCSIQLDAYYNRLFASYVQRRKKDFENIINHIDNSADGMLLKNMLDKLMKNDPILTMTSLDSNALSKLLGDNYDVEYRAMLDNTIASLDLSENNAETLKMIDVIRRKLPLLKKANAHCLKMLSDVRTKDGEFDTDRLKTMISEIIEND